MKRQYKCFYGSSYDRGLEHLLDMWPAIKRDVPEAELHIYYGWQLFDKVYGPNGLGPNPERQAWKEKINTKMKQEGITHHGRVGQKQLLQEMREYGIFSYPTDFDEISCITAMNSQILGLIPVTMNRAALKETVKYGTKLDGDIADKQVQKEYIKALVSWLKDENKQKAVRKEMCDWARSEFAWSKVAKEWSSEFNSPKVYSVEWASRLFNSLPKELQKNEYKSYRI